MKAVLSLQEAISKVKPGNPQVKTCIDKVDALNEALNAAGTWINQQTDK